MVTKVCRKCEIEKSVEEFNRQGNRIKSQCKKCLALYCATYLKVNRTEINEQCRKWNEEHKELQKPKHQEYYRKNKEKINARKKVYYRNHKDQSRAVNRAWRAKNKKKYSETNQQYVQKRSAADSVFKLRVKMSKLISAGMKRGNFTKKSRTREMVELDFEYLKNYLEYTWFLNYGTEYDGQPVHIDHIVPCSAANTEQEIIALQHWSNLQYLTPEDNLAKSDRG